MFPGDMTPGHYNSKAAGRVSWLLHEAEDAC